MRHFYRSERDVRCRPSGRSPRLGRRMMPVAPLTAAGSLLAHHPIGASTWVLVDERGNWPALAAQAAWLSPCTTQLAARERPGVLRPRPATLPRRPVDPRGTAADPGLSALERLGAHGDAGFPNLLAARARTEGEIARLRARFAGGALTAGATSRLGE